MCTEYVNKILSLVLKDYLNKYVDDWKNKYNYPVLRCPECGNVVIEDGLNQDGYTIFKCSNCDWSDGDENEI